jgi:prepilin-type N-terminal cleavage/methylation domain-containing protein
MKNKLPALFECATRNSFVCVCGNQKSKIKNQKFVFAFTLIEVLVVVSIIAILMGLILGAAGYAMSRARRSRVETERETLITVIQSYKADKGFYPQDNPNNYGMSPLFYELTGTTVTTNGNPPVPASYFSSTSGDTLTVANVTSIFGVGGFVNSSPDSSQVKNYFAAANKTARTGRLNTGVTIFGVVIQGPNQLTMTNGLTISPWYYNSSNPTNNPGSYDLWMDVYYSGKTNRISNWSQNPQLQ